MHDGPTEWGSDGRAKGRTRPYEGLVEHTARALLVIETGPKRRRKTRETSGRARRRLAVVAPVGGILVILGLAATGAVPLGIKSVAGAALCAVWAVRMIRVRR